MRPPGRSRRQTRSIALPPACTRCRCRTIPNGSSIGSISPDSCCPSSALAVIGLGWWGASGTKYVYQEIPYLISGGIFGLALVFVGAALFARYSVARLLRFWLARLVVEEQLQADRVVEAIERVAEALTAQAAAINRLADERGPDRHPAAEPPS